MKIALYRSLSLDFESICEVVEYYENNDDFIRLTEIIDVEFADLKDADVINKQVKFIDNQIKTVQAASEIKLNELKQKRDELLALPELK